MAAATMMTFTLVIVAIAFSLFVQTSSATLSEVSPSKSDLILVQILYRHGDRSPVKGYPNDPVKEWQWPQGFGQLTTKGMEQHYELGQFLRSRYSTANGTYPLINANYSRLEICVNSTNYDRTLMSADSNLAGLFPPTRNETFTPGLPWQPIPVHTRPLDTDHILWTDGFCPKYNEEYANFFATSDKVRKEEETYKNLYAFVKEKTGLAYVNISDIWQVYDSVFCQEQNEFGHPLWLNETIYGDLKYLNDLGFDWQFNAEPLFARLKGGPLLGEMVENMKAKISRTMVPETRKMFIYSAHDSTVAALTSAMNIYNGIAPPYASTVMVELHNSVADNQTVQVWYRNDSATDPYQLMIPGCAVDCPFPEFVRLTKAAIPVDWDTECGRTNAGFGRSTNDIILLSVIGLLGVLALALVLGLIWQRRAYRASPLYMPVNSSDA